MLAEPWGYARENIAPLVLVEIWAAPPYLGGVKLRPPPSPLPVFAFAFFPSPSS
jgi:hypothetical protein